MWGNFHITLTDMYCPPKVTKFKLKELQIIPISPNTPDTLIANLDGVVERVLDGSAIPLVDTDRLQLLRGSRRGRR